MAKSIKLGSDTYLDGSGVYAQQPNATPLSGQGENIFCKCERVGNIVSVTGVLSHQTTSWTIFGNLPIPAINYDDTIDQSGVVIGTLHDGTPIYVNSAGSLQVRTGTFSAYHNFSGTYICQ